MPQPNWRDDLRDFKKLGRPRLFFGVSAGCMDSMVNKYTANKRLRSEDAYTPDGRHDMRPEYPSIVYTQILKKSIPMYLSFGRYRSIFASCQSLRLLARLSA